MKIDAGKFLSLRKPARGNPVRLIRTDMAEGLTGEQNAGVWAPEAEARAGMAELFAS
ncbi:MAG: hypothetical protein JWM59_3460 [Verrucomicrobiales bacterium]|nr:hypothetical protein [Verrucomicrobiales bacterium]